MFGIFKKRVDTPEEIAELEALKALSRRLDEEEKIEIAEAKASQLRIEALKTKLRERGIEV